LDDHSGVTDAGIPALIRLETLRQLWLEETAVTDEAEVKLRQALPKLYQLTRGSMIG